MSLVLDVLSDRVKLWKRKVRSRFDVARHRRCAAFFDAPEALVPQHARAAVQAQAQGERMVTKVVASISNHLCKCMYASGFWWRYYGVSGEGYLVK